MPQFSESERLSDEMGTEASPELPSAQEHTHQSAEKEPEGASAEPLPGAETASAVDIPSLQFSEAELSSVDGAAVLKAVLSGSVE